MKKLYYFLTLFVFLANIQFADAIEEVNLDLTEPEQSSIKGNITDNEYLFGDCLGLRSKLLEHGLDIQSSYTVSLIQTIPNSALNRKNSDVRSKMNYKGLYNLSAEIDTEKMKLWKGGKLFVNYQVANKGYSPNFSTGSYLTVDSLDTGNKSIHQLSEYWYEQSFKDKFSLKIGKQDANADFQNIEDGFEFVNLSFSYIPTTPLPFYPTGQLGARAKYDITKHLTVQNGFYSGELETGSYSSSFFRGNKGYFNISQLTVTPEIKGLGGKYSVGGWVHTADTEKFDGHYAKNNHGYYVMAQQSLYKKKEDDNQGLDIILQGGWVPADRNFVSNYYGTALLYKGPVKKRDNDAIGLGWARAGFSRNFAGYENKSENVIEAFYKFQLTKYFFVQPDFQYILNPLGKSGSAFAFGIRTGVKF